MTQRGAPRSERPGEFELIERLFVPLARNFPGAVGLADDLAYLPLDGSLVAAGEELVFKTDAIVAGVHFLPDDPPELVARKLMRVNLSDLAAKGARPIIYTLALILPASIDYAWLEKFAAGLEADQNEFGISLAGGDTDGTPGPLSLSLTAIGAIPAGRRLLRAAAKPGDVIFVSGSIGDGALGLKAIRGELAGLAAADRDFLADRYRLPRPRLTLGARLHALAHASMDISDGLVGDLQHICDASGVGARIERALIPLSDAARRAIAADDTLIASVLAGGDDYELLFTAPPEHAAELAAAGHAAGVPVTEIGAIEAGTRVRVLAADGAEMRLDHTGYRHF